MRHFAADSAILTQANLSIRQRPFFVAHFKTCEIVVARAAQTFKATVAAQVSAWLEKFTVYLRMTWEPRWQLEMYYKGQVLAAIALQLALAVADAESLFTCNGCGRPYIRSKQRKPNAGQANFCSEFARGRKPQREAEMRYRENRREARKLS